MKLFKWIAADPEKLDKGKPYHVMYYNIEEVMTWDELRENWMFDSGMSDGSTWNWEAMQVAVDAEVSEEAFAEWVVQKGFVFRSMKERWVRLHGFPPEQTLTTAELYQEFLKQLQC